MLLAACGTLVAAVGAARSLHHREATRRTEVEWLRARLIAMDARLRALEIRADASVHSVDRLHVFDSSVRSGPPPRPRDPSRRP